jgi:hypothetical protein
MFPESSSSLVNLPTELLEEIISRLDIGSLFCLATCSQFLFYLCRNRIVSILKSQCGHLAGTSLVCVGGYLDADDYPPGMDWQSKMEELQKEFRDGPGTRHLGSEKPEPALLYDVAQDFARIEKPNGSLAYESMPSEQFNEFILCLDNLPHANQKDLDFLLNFDHRWFYINSPDWVLRNLTTKEFVRRSVVAHGSNGPFTCGGVGLGEVLLSRICWSSDPSAAMSCEGIHRGIWAGHKFDITLMEAFEGEVGWKDVSESMHDEITGIWQREYGDDWEKAWCFRYGSKVGNLDDEWDGDSDNSSSLSSLEY